MHGAHGFSYDAMRRAEATYRHNQHNQANNALAAAAAAAASAASVSTPSPPDVDPLSGLSHHHLTAAAASLTTADHQVRS